MRKLSHSGAMSEARRFKTLALGRATGGGAGCVAIPQANAQNQMIIANAAHAWTLLAAPAAQYQVPIAGADPYTPIWAALTVAAISDLAYAAPALTLSTSNVEGSADTVIRSDATVLVFDTTAPNTIEPDDWASIGSASVAARRDHEHGITCATPVATGTANAEGAATSFSRSDHVHLLHNHDHSGDAGDGGQLDWDLIWSDAVHNHTSDAEGGILDLSAISDLDYAVPALTLSISNAAGAANTVIRSDATILIFDATAPDIIQPDDSAAAGSAAVAARRDHTHGIVCAAPASPSVDLAASAEGSGTSFARADHAHQLSQAIAPTWTGIHTHAANVIFDDGAGDSPQLQFVGGSNDDTVSVFLDDDAVAGNSDLVIRLCAADDGSQWIIQDNSPATVAYINAAGDAYFLRSVSVLEANPSPGTRAFNISKNNLSFTTNFNAFVLDLVKTGGVTDENDTIDAMDFSFEINQPGGVVGATRAANFAAVLTAGTVGAVATVRDMAGMKSLLNLDGGTITNDAFAIECFIDQEAGNTITRNAYGMRIRADYDGTVTGTAYGLEIESRSNVDVALHVEAGATTAILVDDGHVVFNENGVASDDFRVETNNMTHGFFVDAGLQRVGINDSTPDAMLDITCRTSTEIGLIVQAAAAQSVSIAQYQDSAGNIFFNSGDGLVNSEVVWNEQGLDIDFRVEAVGQINALFVQGSDGDIGMGTHTPAGILHLYRTADTQHRLVIDAKGTSSGQTAVIDLVTLGDGAKTVGDAATLGWHFSARGNAYTTSGQQNDLFIAYWDGSDFKHILKFNHGGIVELPCVTGALLLPRLTTTQRDAVAPESGMIIYNTTTAAFNFFEDEAWVTK